MEVRFAGGITAIVGPNGCGKSNLSDAIVWVLGDSGTANRKARAVRDAYLNFTGSRHTDLWLMLGDNAYPDGTDEEYQAAVFENMYEDMLRHTI